MGIDTRKITPLTLGQIGFICGLTLVQLHAYITLGKLAAYNFNGNQYRVNFDDFKTFRAWLALEGNAPRNAG